MAVTVEEFTAFFPEFMSLDYPDEQVTVWLAVGEKMTSADAWGSLYSLGVSLFAAHQLTLGRQSAMAVAAGGTAGAGGIASSKTVDKVSVSYDTASAAVADAGNWNLTTYGTRRVQLARMLGAGGVQL